MAEKDSARSSVDDIQEQIRKLEKEKEEIEKRNERQRLEQRLQLLQEDVTSLKSGPSPGPSARRSGRESNEFNSSLDESQARLRSLQQSVLNASFGGASSGADDSRDDIHRSSDDAEDLDDVMSAKHKQALRINRDILVENMTPDDIFNDLISKHILTNSDVSRIKEKNTIEAINEELLNVLIRRSDKAFHVFVSSLRRTLQGWLANRLDPSSQGTNKRKRKTGEINVNVDCERIVPVRNKRFTCTCQEVEEQILFMAKGAFAHIRRRDASPAAFEQFKKELQQTNQVIKESMEIRNTLKELCRHGDLVDLSEGSVCFTIRCWSLAACKELWEVYKSGRLLAVFQRNLVSPFLLKICGASDIHLCLRISRLEFLTCALELAYKERKQMLVDCNKRTPIKKRLRKRKIHHLGNEIPIKCSSFGGEYHNVFRDITNNRQDINERVAPPVWERNTTVSSHQIKQQRLEMRGSLNFENITNFCNENHLAKHQCSNKRLTRLKSPLLVNHNPVQTKSVSHKQSYKKPSHMLRCLDGAFLPPSISPEIQPCPYNLRYRLL